MELVQMGQGGEVNLDLQDHRDEDYQTPKQQRKAFEGKGYKLGKYEKPHSSVWPQFSTLVVKGLPLFEC